MFGRSSMIPVEISFVSDSTIVDNVAVKRLANESPIIKTFLSFSLFLISNVENRIPFGGNHVSPIQFSRLRESRNF